MGLMSPSDQSDFGRGIVVCLVKFSEHLGNRHAETVATLRLWEKLKAADKALTQAEAVRFPRGDSAYRMSMVSVQTIGSALHMWANGARDHFLDLDREKSPPALLELADLVLSMGSVWPRDRDPGIAEWERVRELWEAATVAVDVGFCGVDAEWGAW